MRLFFIDDSYQRDTSLYAHGGIIVDEAALRPLALDLRNLKRRYKIPPSTELKWSPGPDHFLRTEFKGDRTPLYSEALELLRKHDAVCICAVNLLSECYGIKEHGWPISKAKTWAAQTQMVWLAERFQSPLLAKTETNGMMILDRASHVADNELIRSLDFDLLHGTAYRQLDNIAMSLMTADSTLCAPLELADLVVGVTVSWLGGGKWSAPLFPLLLDRFLHQYYASGKKFAATPSMVIVGYGLKLFPRPLEVAAHRKFESLPEKLYTDRGFTKLGK